MSPFTLMRRLTEDMDRMFMDWGAPSGAQDVWWPSVEGSESDGNLIISADLPGLKQEDVKVEVRDGSLVLKGERKREHEESGEGFYRSERSYGRFRREIPLPEGADLDRARAEFTNGELKVTIPAPEGGKNAREIPIASGPGGAKTR